jgi:hypothetical protein
VNFDIDRILKNSGPIETSCCGTITRCEGKCLLLYGFGGAGKCTRCNWIWEMPPGQEAYPLSDERMREAHS